MNPAEELQQAGEHLRQAEEDLRIARSAEREAEQKLDEALHELREAEEHRHDDHHVLVEVATTSGFYPDGQPSRVPVNQLVETELLKAASALKLTNTSNWVAAINKRQINPKLSFEANALKGKIVIDWGPPAGGGGGLRCIR